MAALSAAMGATRPRKVQRSLPVMAAIMAAACVMRSATHQWAFANIQAAHTSLTARQAYIAAEIPEHKVLQDAGASPLMIAAWAGDDAKIKSLVDDGAVLDEQDDFGWTAIRYAVRNSKPAAAQTLVDLGADVNLASKTGRTPLMSSAGNGLVDMVDGLLKSGADVTLKDNNGMTALEHARFGMPQLKEMLQVAVDKVGDA